MLTLHLSERPLLLLLVLLLFGALREVLDRYRLRAYDFAIRLPLTLQLVGTGDRGVALFDRGVALIEGSVALVTCLVAIVEGTIALRQRRLQITGSHVGQDLGAVELQSLVLQSGGRGCLLLLAAAAAAVAFAFTPFAIGLPLEVTRGAELLRLMYFAVWVPRDRGRARQEFPVADADVRLAEVAVTGLLAVRLWLLDASALVLGVSDDVLRLVVLQGCSVGETR